jgi:hypothetical protein
MDQRGKCRKRVSLEAVLACPRFGLMKGLITDLSLGGLYFKAETAIVPIGAEVSVTFQPQQEMSSACLTLAGRVVHQSLRGFGIVFDDDMPETCRCMLGELLPELQPVAEQPRSLRSAL